MKRKRFTFDVKKAIPAAWDLIWKAHRIERKKDEAYERKHGKKPYGWERTYYTTATDVERTVRDFALDTSEGKPWRTEHTGYGYPNGIRISGDLKRSVRDWLLHNPKIVGHNFGRGHISGARFRPVGEPLAEAEKKTIAKHEQRRAGLAPPKPIHFHDKGLLCQKARKAGRFFFSRGRTTTRTTTDRSKVTCKQCLNLLKNMKEVAKVVDPYAGLDSLHS